MKFRAGRYLGRSSAAALVLAALAPATSALAQDDQSDETTAASADDQLAEGAAQTAGGEIIVTGSRLGRSAFNSPTPVNVVGQERMNDLAITNVADALNQIPSFRPITSPSTNSFRASSNIAARTLDLRGLGSTRTLVLIDGRRTVPSTEEGRFDLNSVPSIMVQRSEVVTGGASAAYGADAVAGVVNLILDTRMTGVKGEASYGISEYGDAQKVNFGLMAGTTFADGRGHIVIGGEYADEDGIGGALSRDWSSKFHGFIGNPFWSPNGGNTQPANIAADNALFAINPGGVVTAAGPLQGLQFNDQGNLVPFQFGDYFNRAKPSIQMIGGDPSIQDVYGCDACALYVANSHISTLGHVEYEFSPSVTFKAELAYSRVTGGPSHGSTSLNYGTTAPITIKRDNPFLTDQAKAVMDAAGVTSFPIGRSHQELGYANYTSRNETWRGMLGLEGSLGNGWSWDVYYSYGRTDGRLEGSNTRREDRWNQAIDPVAAPAGIAGIPEGTIVCRSTLTNPNNGCVPANVLGPDMVSDAVANWVMADIWQTRRFEQHAAAANLRGTLLENWAGDVSFATGVEYRSDHSEGTQDPLTAMGPTVIAAANATVLPPMTQKVKEGYVEVGVPLFADTGMGSLNVDGALRYTDYSLTGSAWTWKLGAVWDVSNALMLRVTRSRDIRAPNALELNPNTTSSRFPLNDPKLNVAYEIPSYFGGNPDLRLEKGDTFTAGAVLQPSFVPDLRLSLDYYNIKVSDAIDTISNALAIILCRQGNTDVCTIGPDDRITQLRSTYQNVNTLRAAGFEGVASYRLDVGGGSAVNMNVNANYVTKLETELPDGSVRNFVGVTGNAGAITNIVGVPKWKADAVITYDNPLFSLTAHGRYIPPALLSRDYIGPDQAGYSPNLPNSINNNHIDGRFYLDIGARVKLYGEGNDRIELFGGIDNVLDKDPPSNLRFIGNGLYFDPLGRYYKMGVRVNM